jgi:hypothetical protein
MQAKDRKDNVNSSRLSGLCRRDLIHGSNESKGKPNHPRIGQRGPTRWQDLGPGLVETTNQIVSGEALPLNPGKDLWLILGSPRGRLRNALSRALREFEAEKPLSAMEIYGILEGLMGGSTWTAGSKVCLKEPNRNGILNMVWKIRP